MAADQGGSRQRAHDPLVAGLGDAVAHGYRALDRVAVGFAESARRIQASGAMRTAPTRTRTAASPVTLQPSGQPARAERPSARRRTSSSAPPTLVGELADLTADVLDRLGEAARDIADRIGEDDLAEPESEVTRLTVRGHAGRPVSTDLQFTNTGSIPLEGLEFDATPLLGFAGAIPADSVAFLPRDAPQTDDAAGAATTSRLRPRGTTLIEVEVTIPGDAAPGTYRGLVMVRSAAAASQSAERQPVGAWASLELEVLASDPR
jgi:hypothetical protein